MCMAEDKGYTMTQFILLSIYNTIMDWPEPEDNFQLLYKKLEALKKVQEIINKPKL